MRSVNDSAAVPFCRLRRYLPIAAPFRLTERKTSFKPSLKGRIMRVATFLPGIAVIPDPHSLNAGLYVIRSDLRGFCSMARSLPGSLPPCTRRGSLESRWPDTAPLHCFSDIIKDSINFSTRFEIFHDNWVTVQTVGKKVFHKMK